MLFRSWFNARAAGSSRGHPVGPQSPGRRGAFRPCPLRRHGEALRGETHARGLQRRHQRAPVHVAAEALALFEDDVARIVVEGDKATLEDLGSKNGTFVNGKRLSAAAGLADGDEVRLGSVPFAFRMRRDAVSTATSARARKR